MIMRTYLPRFSNAGFVTLFVLAAILTLVVVGTGAAQTGGSQAAGSAAPQPTPISYEASVKPNNSAEPRTITEYFPGGRYSATAVTVRALLWTAYRMQDQQLAGAPAWFSSKRYNIAAKADGTPPTLLALLRALLADHFQACSPQRGSRAITIRAGPYTNRWTAGPPVAQI
jgi:hypothetical protein